MRIATIKMFENNYKPVTTFNRSHKKKYVYSDMEAVYRVYDILEYSECKLIDMEQLKNEQIPYLRHISDVFNYCIIHKLNTDKLISLIAVYLKNYNLIEKYELLDVYNCIRSIQYSYYSDEVLGDDTYVI